MHQTTITFPDELYRSAETKAGREGTSLPEVVRSLLAQWVGREAVTQETPAPDQSTIDLAMSSRGMWNDRDPDEFLELSRSRLADRDRELENAKLDVG